MPSVLRSAVLLTAIACSAACAKPATDADSAGKSDKAKAAEASSPAAERKRNSTMIGMNIAKQMEPIKDEIDVDALAAAMKASFAGKPTGLTAEEAEKVSAEFGQKMQLLVAKKQMQAAQENLKKGEDFLAANKTKPGVHTTASGLEYQVIRMGSGPMPKATDKVRVLYTGRLLNGEKFDSTDDHGGQPVEFMLNQVVPGWSEGLTLMPVNSKFRFWIPSSLAYGPNGQPPIGPNETLEFEVELQGIVN